MVTAASQRRAHQLFEAVHEQHAVRQAGQRIGAPRRQLRADARERHREVDRLGDVVVGAEIERLDRRRRCSSLAVTMMTGSSATDATSPQAAQRFDAAHARHHHVEQDEVDALLGNDDRAPARRFRP